MMDEGLDSIYSCLLPKVPIIQHSQQALQVKLKREAPLTVPSGNQDSWRSRSSNPKAPIRGAPRSFCVFSFLWKSKSQVQKPWLSGDVRNPTAFNACRGLGSFLEHHSTEESYFLSASRALEVRRGGECRPHQKE